MGKEIQSEKLPIFDSQKSTKSTIKLLKMSQLKAFKVDQTFCNTLYIESISIPTLLPPPHQVVLRQGGEGRPEVRVEEPEQQQ